MKLRWGVVLLSVVSFSCAGPARWLRPQLPPSRQGVLLEEEFSDDGWNRRWHERSIRGRTRYERRTDPAGQAFLHARSERTASYLALPFEFDPRDHPRLEWRWRVTRALRDENLLQRGGSDAAARVYVMFDTGPLPWQKRLINYVWSSQLPRGTQLFSAYSNRSGIIVVRSREEIGAWQTESRNLVEDYRALFQEDPPVVEGIAVMTDTDNTQGTAEADFDGIVLR